jgi:hypothetical protein
LSASADAILTKRKAQMAGTSPAILVFRGEMTGFAT